MCKLVFSYRCNYICIGVHGWMGVAAWEIKVLGFDPIPSSVNFGYVRLTQFPARGHLSDNAHTRIHTACTSIYAYRLCIYVWVFVHACVCACMFIYIYLYIVMQIVVIVYKLQHRTCLTFFCTSFHLFSAPDYFKQ